MVKSLVEKQRSYFNGGATKNIGFRRRMLEKLAAAITRYEPRIYQALRADLNKSKPEAYLTEIQIVKAELKAALQNLNRWAKPKSVFTPITHFPGSSKIYRDPYGVVLILSPWNYPFQLAIAPLVGAIAAGNCVILKASKSSPHVSEVLRVMLEETFEERYLCCVPEKSSYEEVMEQHYDFIFFTGSERVGKVVMEAASRHVTPVVLELGGKSPCIVERTADLKVAAKRIVWGKFLNAGQTCVAPDYLLVDETVKAPLLKLMQKYVRQLYHSPLGNPDYPKIINRHHYDRLFRYIEREPEKLGGKADPDLLKIEPTIFINAHFDSEIMQEEIFGPILPVISYHKLDDVLDVVQQRARPLALYLFTRDRRVVKKVVGKISFGGGCVNDVIMHLANHHLPFGGVGSSGMGSYHGKYSFDTFSRPKSVLKSAASVDLPLRYPPYGKGKFSLIQWLTK